MCLDSENFEILGFYSRACAASVASYANEGQVQKLEESLEKIKKLSKEHPDHDIVITRLVSSCRNSLSIYKFNSDNEKLNLNLEMILDISEGRPDCELTQEITAESLIRFKEIEELIKQPFRNKLEYTLKGFISAPEFIDMVLDKEMNNLKELHGLEPSSILPEYHKHSLIERVSEWVEFLPIEKNIVATEMIQSLDKVLNL